MNVLLPELTFVEGRFRPGFLVAWEDGRLTRVEPAPPGAEGIALPGRALLPGLVNAHSHGFQRAIRGRTEFRSPEKTFDDFWSWRERMYQAALGLSPEQIKSVTAMAYLEMLLSGVTAVGEFHYVHRQADGTPYDEPDELAHQVAAAAEDTGIRLRLLRVAYARAGFGAEPNPRQARFIDAHWEESVEAVQRLAQRGLLVGLAPHSVRAVPLDWLGPLHEYALTHGLPFHMHVAEQPRELEECKNEHGLQPVQLLEREGLIDDHFTAVHAIHLAEEEVLSLGRHRAVVCSCPTTERNLGDGILPADRLLQAGVELALGTDSQCQIDLFEDARQLDYHLRLERLERAVLDPREGPGGMGRLLLRAATAGGARALRLPVGALEPGLRADLVALDLHDPSIAGSAAEELADALVFAGGRLAVREVWVEGRQVVSEGRHPLQEGITREFLATMEALRGQA